MIDFICGTLVQKSPTSVVIESGGFGLTILISLPSFDRLPALGTKLQLSTLLVVREDSLTLFGFVQPEERELFEKLTQVSGIGPKLALTTLSGLPLEVLIQAISDGDVKRLSSISGIGKKMAERMVVELRDKLGFSVASETQPSQAIIPPSSRDAILALVALGYKQQEASKLIEKAQAQSSAANLGVEDLVRLALSGK